MFLTIFALRKEGCLQEKIIDANTLFADRLPNKNRNGGMSFMKVLLTILLSLTCVSAHASLLNLSDLIPSVEGGVGVGNGGGMVVCRDPSSHQINSAELLDYFEAREIRGINIDISSIPGTWKVKAQAIIDRLGLQSQLRNRIYSLWLQSFENESKFISGLEFNKISDSMDIGVPKGCEFEQAAIQIVPRFAEDNRYYINQDIWNALDENNKAGLVLHELIYREALSYGQTDSIGARYFNSFITSSNFSKISFAGFLNVLAQARFEETDFPLNDPDFSMVYMTKHFWRVGADEKFTQELGFKNRIVGSVGTCDGDGCKTFLKSILDFDIDGNISRLTISRGVKELSIADWKFVSGGLLDNQSDDNGWQGSPLDLSIRSGKLSSLKVADLNTPNYLLRVEKTKLETENIAYAYFDRTQGTNLHLIGAQYFKMDGYVVEVGNQTENGFGCKIVNVQFNDQLMIDRVYVESSIRSIKSGCNTSVEPEVILDQGKNKPYQANIHARPTELISNQGQEGNIFIFDPKTGVLESTYRDNPVGDLVGLNYIDFKSGWSYWSIGNLSSIFPNIYSSETDSELGRIYRLNLKSKTRIEKSDSAGNEIVLEVLPQEEMNLYSNGAPQTLTIANDYQLKNINDEIKTYQSGSLLQLNDQGLVISARGPGARN